MVGKTFSGELIPDDESGLNIREKFYSLDRDSTLIVSEDDSVSIPVSGGDSLEISLEESSLRDDLLDILYGAIFRDSSRTDYRDISNLTESEEKFLPHKGQIIANIYISKVPVFGGSVDDTVKFTITAIDNFGNSLHVNTKDWVIKNNLIFYQKDDNQTQPFYSITFNIAIKQPALTDYKRSGS